MIALCFGANATIIKDNYLHQTGTVYYFLFL